MQIKETSSISVKIACKIIINFFNENCYIKVSKRNFFLGKQAQFLSYSFCKPNFNIRMRFAMGHIKCVFFFFLGNIECISLSLNLKKLILYKKTLEIFSLKKKKKLQRFFVEILMKCEVICVCLSPKMNNF